MASRTQHSRSLRCEDDITRPILERGRSELSGVRLGFNRRKIARHREIQTCQTCRSRKIKCDQSKPRCQNCRASNRDCSYQIKTSTHKDPGPPQVRDRPVADTYERGPPAHESDTVRLNQLGHLSGAGNNPSQYYSTSSWKVAPETAATLTPRSEDEGTAGWEGSSGLTLPNGSQDVTLPTASSAYFIQSHEVDHLILWYSSHCHFWHPIFDIQEITANLHISRRQGNPTSAFVAQVAAICYSAASSISASGDIDINSSRLVPPSTWKTRAEKSLHLADYPFRPSLDTVRAAYLLATPSSTEEALQFDPGPVCVLLRAAQRLGLHREPASFHLPRRESDLRRVVWWSIHALEVSYAVSHALPPLLHPGTFDVTVIGTEDRLDFKLIATVSRVSVVISRALYEIYGAHQPTYAEIQELDRQIAQTCAHELEGNENSPRTTTLDRFILMSRRMCCSKMIYIVHQPYLRSSLWPDDSRPKVISACRNYIEDFICLTSPDFAPFRWVLDHYNVMHACAILLQDLIQTPMSLDADAIRSTVETCFLALSANSHPNLGKLELLRSKAWSANAWTVDVPGSLEAVANASLSDWDPLFASIVWDDFPLQSV